MSKKNTALASKIKRMMQADEDVGKIAQQTPTVIAHAMEVFLEQLAKGSSAIATARGDKVLSTSHLKTFVDSNPNVDFLKEIVAKAPDLKEKVASSPAKRQRKTNDRAKPAKKRSKTSEEESQEAAAKKPRQRKASGAKKGTADAKGIKAESKAGDQDENQGGHSEAARHAGEQVKEEDAEEQAEPDRQVPRDLQLGSSGPAGDVDEEDDYDAD